MRIRLEINLKTETATLQRDSQKKIYLKGQWMEFFAVLGWLRCNTSNKDRYLLPESLCAGGRWSSKNTESARKEIARYIKELEDQKFIGIFDLHATPRTKKWRLALSPRDIRWIPNRAEASKWLQACGWEHDFLITPKWSSNLPIEWIMISTKSLINFYSGNLERAVDLAHESRKHSPNIILSRISDLLILRSSIRLGIDNELEDNPEKFNDHYVDFGDGIIGKSLYIRTAALRAFQLTTEDSINELQYLRRVATKLREETTDIGGLGIIYNTMAVASRRADKPNDGESYLQQAIPLAIASGDLVTLQNAIFNLGHCRYARLQKDGQKPDKIVFQLIDLDREMRRTLGLGKDSAQCEILGANLALKVGDVNLAEGYLNEAEEFVSSDYDQACFHREKAKLIWKQDIIKNRSVGKLIRDKVTRELRISLRLFRQAGHAVPKVEQELKDVSSNGFPKSW